MREIWSTKKLLSSCGTLRSLNISKCFTIFVQGMFMTKSYKIYQIDSKERDIKKAKQPGQLGKLLSLQDATKTQLLNLVAFWMNNDERKKF